MKNSFIYAAKTALYLLLLTGLFAACSNSTGSEEEEQEPVAIRVKQNNQTIVERNNETSTITGSLTLRAGSTSTFTVLFVDETGVEFTPDPEEHSILVSSSSGIVTFANINSETAPFSFDAQANEAGTTTFQIVMNHVGAPEFTAAGLPIEISASN